MKAARVAVEPTEHPMSDPDDYEPHHASSPTDHVLSELQLFGYRPFTDEPDPRPLPVGDHVAGAIADIFDALIVPLEDTRPEPDLADTLWSTDRKRVAAGKCVSVRIALGGCRSLKTTTTSSSQKIHHH